MDNDTKGQQTATPLPLIAGGRGLISARQILLPNGKGTDLSAGPKPVDDPLPGCDPDLHDAQVTSLYIHVPFCFHKCHYCDFYSIVDTRDRQEGFTHRLLRELEALAPLATGPLLTVFVGGGTPSLLRVELWKQILQALDERFHTRSIKIRGGEFTVECNPETVTRELMDVLVEGGVTRVSMGAQSFHPVHLKTLERWHNPENVGIALGLAASAGIDRRSIDLIFAIPGQKLHEWEADLRTAMSLGTEHLSCYALTYEQGTAMTARLNRGDFEPADDDLEAEMFDLTLAVSRSMGFERYEISNFARPKRECRHNLVYWRQGNWLAAGPSASGHLRGLRWKNAPRLDDYLDKDDQGFAPVIEYEVADLKRGLFESLMTGLRLAEGVDSERILRIASRVGVAAAAGLQAWASELVESGKMTSHDGRWTLTDSGMRITNAILIEASDALDGE